jgi:hypothetical protein
MDSLEKLTAERNRLKDLMTCQYCKKDRVQTLYIPCRHLIACETCAANENDCLKCGAKILATVRTFLC